MVSVTARDYAQGLLQWAALATSWSTRCAWSLFLMDTSGGRRGAVSIKDGRDEAHQMLHRVSNPLPQQICLPAVVVIVMKMLKEVSSSVRCDFGGLHPTENRSLLT